MEPLHGGRIETTAAVADPDVHETYECTALSARLIEPLDPPLGLAEVLPQTFPIAFGSDGGDDASAIRTFPKTDVEGNGGRCHPVAELLGGEAPEAAVSGYGRQREPESEAIGQEQVTASTAELAPEESVAVKNVANERLRGHDVDVGRVEHAAGQPPAAPLDQTFQTLVFLGVVLLHQHVAEGPFEAHYEEGVVLEKREVLLESRRHEVANRVLNRPAPLRIQVHGGDHVQGPLAVGSRRIVSWGVSHRSPDPEETQWTPTVWIRRPPRRGLAVTIHL